MDTTKTQGILLSLAAFSILAFADTFTKALTDHFDIFALGLYLNYATIAFLIPIIIYKGGFRKAFATQSLPQHVMRGLFMLGIFISIIYALKNLPIANVYTIAYTMPFILNILAMTVLKEKISLYRWLAIIGAFVGILVALRPGVIGISSGALAAMVVAILLAFNTILVKFVHKDDGWLTYIVYPMLVQTPILAVIVLMRGEPLIPDWSLLTWAMLAGGGGLFALGLSILPQAIKRTETAIFGYTQYITFVWAIILGYLVFGDVLDLWTAAGAAIIVASGIFLIYREKVEHSRILKLEEKEHGTTG